MKDEQPSYSSVNGDPDATMNKIVGKVSSLDYEDSTGRSHISSNSNDYSYEKEGPLTLVTSTGQEKLPCVFGNDLRNKNPVKMGYIYTLLFYKEQPLICIGAFCKTILILLR